MKTPDEIKKGQKLCLLGTACGRCPYYNVGHGVAACIGCLTQDTLDYIQQLEAKDVKQSQRIAELEQELAAIKRERDAAVRGLHGDCETCKHYETENCAYCVHDPDAWCAHEDNWEWEGVCPENTEVQDGHSDA